MTDAPTHTTDAETSAETLGRNRLGNETSPYLLQHVDNPVHWMAWDDTAFARARAENKPILLSVGYAACHWCHVMAHESFEDPATAAVMNERFVSIKVDREERPDVDAIYQNALALLGEQGGWPLTMFLTPAGEPFWGGTYFPPEDRWGRPAFKTVLTRISEIYADEGDKVKANVTALREAMEKITANKPGGTIPLQVSDQIADHFLRSVDTRLGGLGGAPKFPQSSVFILLWRAWRRTGHAGFRDAVTVTLERMCQGGIYDHLGGGFARYSTDVAWLVPHFEKMLYDNAQLIELLTTVWQELRTPLYETRVRETIDWLLREMVVGDGGFAGTLDADSEGEEGKFYVWSEAEIDAVLGDDAARFKDAYDVTAGGNWEGKNILNRSAKPVLGDVDHEAFLAACRAKLLARRGDRVRPGLDDKVLADWNGLAVAALAFAGSVFDEPDWIAAARKAFAFVETNMIVDNRLRHSWRMGQARHPATLEDYAALARGAIALFEATQAPAYLETAEKWVADIEAHFGDEGRGYFLSADDVGDVILRTKPVYDNATPSGNGLMLHVLARLYYLTGKDVYRTRADALVKAFSGELERSALGMPVLIAGNELLTQAVQLAVVGPRDAPASAALVKTALGAGEPNLIVQQVADGDALPDDHPAHGKSMVDGMPAAYVCRGTLCTLPITEPAKLTEELTRY